MAKRLKKYMVRELADILGYTTSRTVRLTLEEKIDWEEVITLLKRTDITTREKRSRFYSFLDNEHKADFLWTRFMGDF